MKTIAQLSHRFSWINPAAAALVMLLQRTPVVRLIVATDELVAVSPIGNVLKSALAAVATFGAYDTLAGATVLSTTQPSPLSARVGTAITPVGITVTNTINIGSWMVSGSLPPGLTLSAVEGGNTLTGAGLLDASMPGAPDGYGGTIGGNTSTTPVLSGTPTASGNYTINLTAYEFGAATGLVSNTFPFTVVVTSASTDTAPSITTQPQSQTVTAGAGVTFTAAANGSPAPTYQWNFNGTPIAGATSATYSIASAQSSNAGTYTVIATNSAGSATSNGAVLTVNSGVVNVAPAFTTQPSPVTVASGSAASFTTAATGTPAPTYQWNFNGTPIAGATSATYSIASAQSSNAGTYTVTATNSAGSATSTAAVLTVTTVAGSAPVFTTQPFSVAVVSGSTVAFTVAASGSPVPTYRWAKDGTTIAGATSATLLLSGATAANAGNYTCTATNSGGSTTSNAGALTMTSTTDVGRLTSLSTRAVSGTASDVLIVGFVVSGAGTTGTKPVLMRATGPTLAGFGVSGTLGDPTLALYQGSTQVAFNDNWGGDSQIAAQDAAAQAFPFASPSSLDSALYIPNLAQNLYSAVVSGNNNGTGVALAEVYDLTGAGSYTATTPRLTSISSRVKVGTGDNILIAGFVIGGSSAKTVLIRGSGPALNQFGVPGTLADPKLTLYRSDSTVIVTNNGWGGDPQIVSTAAAVQAFAWTSPTSNDSALLVTLPPGLYSAGISGASGDTGVALVEVYEVP